MSVFIFILVNNIVPVFFLIALGYVISKIFNLDIYTLSKLNFYVLIPAFTLVNLYTTKIPEETLKVIAAALLILFINMFLAFGVSRIRGYDERKKNVFGNSIMFFNAGNIGIPLIILVFSSPPFVINGETPYLNTALTSYIMIWLIQNITTNTIGFLNAGRGHISAKNSLVKVLKMPVIYAIILSFVLKLVPYDMTKIAIWPAITNASNGMVPIVLLTLGVQLTKTSFGLKNVDVYISAFIRLVCGPLISLVPIYLLHFEGILAQVIMIASALPSAVNSALIAVEYDNHPDLASQIVMLTTLISAVSLVGVIYLARIIFPVG